MKLPKLTRFALYAWGVVFYNLLIVLWGVYVRASGSGAGCGAHWPLCNGQVIPQAPAVATMIEFSHRVSSGFTVVLVIILFVWAWRRFPRRHPIRYSAGLSVFFTFTEALVGAGLVLLELVANDASLTRAFSMTVHLINTFLLLAVLTITAWFATDRPPEGFYRRGLTGYLLLICLIAVTILGASGAVTALGDTLFPSKSLAEGFQQDLSPASNFMIRLRFLHPLIAVSTALLTGSVAYWLRKKYQHARLQTFATLLIGGLGLQIGLGILNVALLAPIWMQIVHLLAADFVWLNLVLLTTVVVGTADLLPSLSDQKIHNRIDNTERIR